MNSKLKEKVMLAKPEVKLRNGMEESDMRECARQQDLAAIRHTSSELHLSDYCDDADDDDDGWPTAITT